MSAALAKDDEMDDRAAAFSAATIESGRLREDRSGPPAGPPPLDEGGRLCCHESVGVRDRDEPANAEDAVDNDVGVLASASKGDSFSFVGEEEVTKDEECPKEPDDDESRAEAKAAELADTPLPLFCW